MTATEIVEQIEQLSDQEQQKLAKQKYTIPRLLADDDEETVPTLTEVTEFLSKAGMSAEEFRQAIDLHRRRNEHRSVVQQYTTASAEKPSIEQQIADADAALEAAKQTHRQTVWPLQAKLREINELATRASQARRELQSSCPCEETTERLSSVQFEQRQVGREIEQKSKLVERQKAAIAENKRNGHDTSAMEGRMAEANAELAGLRVRLEQLQNEEREVLESMIER